jgi:hypothetical protein
MPGKVHYETVERIATITLDNPTALNAFDHEMCLGSSGSGPTWRRIATSLARSHRGRERPSAPAGT